MMVMVSIDWGQLGWGFVELCFGKEEGLYEVMRSLG